MRASFSLLLALSVGCGATGAARADEPREIVERAVKAMGGLEKLSKHPAARMKQKGNFDIMGMTGDYTGEFTYQYPNQFKMDLAMEIMGQKIQFVQVLNRDKGWNSVMGMTQELQGAQLDSLKGEVHASTIDALVPLLQDKEKKYVLSLVGEANVKGKPATGVRVSSKDQKDINLYFDKETNFLVKSERRAMDFTAANEIQAESFYSDYKEIGGVKQPGKFLLQHDGKKVIEGEMLEYKLLDKIDDAEFGKP